MPGMAGLHPSENRGYREAYAFARAVETHWPTLADNLPGQAGEPFRKGADAARALLTELDELTPAYGLHGGPAALGLGAQIGKSRIAVRDRFLEKDRAARFAVTEMGYLTTLLGYLAAVAEHQGDERRREFCSRWEGRLRRHENAARKAAMAMGTDPDSAVEPFDTSPAGRAAQKAGYAMGALGEWVDRQAAKRRTGD